MKKGVDVCPEASGYKFFRGFDSPGLSEQLANKTVAEVATVCDSRGTSCQGFNSTGTLKSNIAPFVDWVPTFSVVCVGLFIPESFEVDCSMDGYTFFENKDSPRNDLTQRREDTVRELAQACDDNDRCEGFNSLGILKSFIKPENEMSKFFTLSSSKLMAIFRVLFPHR